MFANIKSTSFVSVVTAVVLAMGISAAAFAGDASTSLRHTAIAADRPNRPSVEPATHCPECRTVTFQRSISLKGNFVRVETVERMECPSCRSALVNLFRIGKFKHTCDVAVASANEHCEH